MNVTHPACGVTWRWRVSPTKRYPGERFGAWVVVERVIGGWVCRCDCGTERILRSSTLTSGRSRSCGNREIHPAIRSGPRRGDNPTYHAAHHRVRREKGPANAHECVDCGERALDWSYTGDDPDELIGANSLGHVMRYSGDPTYYEARCRRCHVVHDSLEAK